MTISNSMTFRWRPDARFPIGAQIAAERLHELRASRGDITPRVVVDDASDEDSPLHPCFEWDNDRAADNFRLQQARQLIGALVVISVDDKPVQKETRAFVHLVNDRPRYEPVEVAMSMPDMRAEVLAKAKSEIAAWRARYASYSEFANLHTRIDDLLAAESAAA